jgi:hypothetical protein
MPSRSDLTRDRLFDYQERFATQLLILVGRQLTSKTFDLLPSEDAQNLKEGLGTLFRHLDGNSNTKFQVDQVLPRPRASTIEASHTYARLDHMVALLDITRRPVDICGNDEFCLFRLVTLKSASEAYSLVSKVNQTLQMALRNTSVHSTATSPTWDLQAQEKMDQWIQSLGLASEKRLGCLLDAVKEDFDNCKMSAKDSAHGVEVQVLNYDTTSSGLSEDWGVRLLCPGMGEWHVGKCEFET